MKTKVYLRVGYNRTSRKASVAASTRPNSKPVSSSSGNPLPTVAFALELDIPDKLFRQAEQVIAEITIPEGMAQVVAEVRHLDD